jgi:hypothetical protein
VLKYFYFIFCYNLVKYFALWKTRTRLILDGSTWVLPHLNRGKGGAITWTSLASCTLFLLFIEQLCFFFFGLSRDICFA